MRTSACLGDGSSFMPNRSTSYFGVKNATISIPHPLHAPLLKCNTQGDFIRAQVIASVIKLYLPLKEQTLKQEEHPNTKPSKAGLQTRLLLRQKPTKGLLNQKLQSKLCTFIVKCSFLAGERQLFLRRHTPSVHFRFLWFLVRNV